jgi:RNA polymerase sigma factor (sigma-70 family)
LQRLKGRVLLDVMRRLAGERAQWLARNIVPHEGTIRAWLRTRAAGLDVDDIIQEMYARIASLASTDDIRDPRQYAMQTAFSILANQFRRARIVPIAAVADLDALAITAPDVAADRALEFRDELRALETTLAELPERCRRAFLLRRVEGLSQKEVAARLAISEKTVEKYMAQAVRLLISVYGRGGKAAAKVSTSLMRNRIGRP